jgi:hypothetical protein
MNNLSDLLSLHKPKSKEILVVRVHTNFFRKKGGYIFKARSIKVLKRKSTGNMIDLIEEDISNSSVEDFINTIINFDDVDDGEYYLKAINITHDFETGYVDGYDWKLFKIQNTC